MSNLLIIYCIIEFDFFPLFFFIVFYEMILYDFFYNVYNVLIYNKNKWIKRIVAIDQSNLLFLLLFVKYIIVHIGT